MNIIGDLKGSKGGIARGRVSYGWIIKGRLRTPDQVTLMLQVAGDLDCGL
jgi:hypothetical protein